MLKLRVFHATSRNFLGNLPEVDKNFGVVSNKNTPWKQEVFNVYPEGFEPTSAEPESAILSIELWVQRSAKI